MSTPVAMDREKWSWKLDFLATNIGFVACFENIWRFPYLCYSNGGVMFLIPYVLCVFFIAMPLMFLEMALGQYTASGSLKAWRISPLFRGIGIASTVVLFWRSIICNVILAWTLYYLYSSCIGSELLWTRCDQAWNTANCLEPGYEWGCVNGTYIPVNRHDAPPDYHYSDSDIDYRSYSSECGDPPFMSFSEGEFWRNHVLEQPGYYDHDGTFNIGGVTGHLVITLFLAWMLIYFCLLIGVGWTAKVFYLTVPVIHLVLFVFMIRGVTLPGAAEGVLFYLSEDKTILAYPRVWLAAAREVFCSFSIGLGAFTALGSYNKFDYNFYRDSMIVSFLNVMTSIYGGVIVFSFIGFASYASELPINTEAVPGTYLFYQVFPRAFALMPGSRAWAFLFFLVVLLIWFNSQLVTVKSFIASVTDVLPSWLQGGYYPDIVVFGLCVLQFLIGIFMVTEGGTDIVLNYVDYMYYEVYSLPLVWICFHESIAIGWFYGFRRFSSHITEMLKWRPIPWYLIGWIVTCPILSMLVWIIDIYLIVFDEVHTDYWNKQLRMIGYIIAASSMLWIHVVMIYTVVYQLVKGDGPIITRLKLAIRPAVTPNNDREELVGMEMT
nr:sodium- and chloride-dependent GABA transporter 1-like [Lytechinus pictus]